VSLRRQIHSAFESIEPSTAGMPDRILRTVQAQMPARTRRNRFMFRLSAPLPLVAIFVVIALVVAIFVGGRFVHDWQTFQHGTPAGQGRDAEFQVKVAQLEQRPLQLPTMKVGDPCPTTGTQISTGFTFGTGPVYVNGGNAQTTAWGNFFDIPYYTAPGLTGPVLIRGSDLMGHAVVFSGATAAGPVVANDPGLPSPALHSEAVIDASSPKLHYGGYGIFMVRQGLPLSAGACFGFQIDGPKFTERFTG
jgi:hypothetical protein